MGIRSAAAIVAAALVVAPQVVDADWLVLRNGTRVETRGAWTQKGRLVVFTATNGSLSSIRADEVDLEASATVTAEAKAPPPPAPEPPKKAVIVLTDADFPRVPTVVGEGSGGRRGQDGTVAATGEKLVVAEWQQVEVGQGIQITGTLRNPSRNTAANALLTVIVFDRAGKQIGRAPASLSATAVPAGEVVEFSAPFPNVTEVGSVEFETDAMFFLNAESGESDGDDAADASAAVAAPQGEYDPAASPNDGVGLEEPQSDASPNDASPDAQPTDGEAAPPDDGSSEDGYQDASEDAYQGT